MPVYNKLVRDGIPDIIRRKGGTPITHVAALAEYRAALRSKLREETDEYLADGHAEELVDVLEVVYALGEVDGISREQLEQIRIRKVTERGPFRDRIILESVSEDGIEE